MREPTELQRRLLSKLAESEMLIVWDSLDGYFVCHRSERVERIKAGTLECLLSARWITREAGYQQPTYRITQAGKLAATAARAAGASV